MIQPQDEMLSIAELAEYLGKSRQSIYQWRTRGVFPFRTYGQGRGLKVSKREVDEYLAREGKAPGREPRESRPSSLASSHGMSESSPSSQGSLDQESSEQTQSFAPWRLAHQSESFQRSQLRQSSSSAASGQPRMSKSAAGAAAKASGQTTKVAAYQTVQLPLAPGTSLELAAEFIRRAQQGREITIILEGDDCFLSIAGR